MNIKELTYYIQSANINFLIGSGASRPYLATLGSIEKLLTMLMMICILILSLNIKLQKHLYTKHFMILLLHPIDFSDTDLIIVKRKAIIKTI